MYSLSAFFLVCDWLLPRSFIIGSNIVMIKLDSFVKAYCDLKSGVERKCVRVFDKLEVLFLIIIIIEANNTIIFLNLNYFYFLSPLLIYNLTAIGHV